MAIDRDYLSSDFLTSAADFNSRSKENREWISYNPETVILTLSKLDILKKSYRLERYERRTIKSI